MNIKISAILLFLSFALVSCFEEDQAVPPYVPPEDVETVNIDKSIYNNQIYFDFSSGTIISENLNSEWVLAFDCMESAHNIWVNSAGLWGLAHTKSKDMSADFSSEKGLTWISDKSDGNPDSTAVGDWLAYKDDQAQISREVMLLGQYDGISYEVQKKVQFLHVDQEHYIFLVADPAESIPDTVELQKNTLFNKLYYSFDNHEIKELEPPKSDWDMLFTQYFTILFTDDGIPTSYYVRGVWQNKHGIQTALDTITAFTEMDALKALDQEFFTHQDAIGHDWKDVEVDEGTNSAVYFVRPGYTYILRDGAMGLYKFRFTSFYNQSGEKGYPSFEYSRLSDPQFH